MRSFFHATFLIQTFSHSSIFWFRKSRCKLSEKNIWKSVVVAVETLCFLCVIVSRPLINHEYLIAEIKLDNHSVLSPFLCRDLPPNSIGIVKFDHIFRFISLQISLQQASNNYIVITQQNCHRIRSSSYNILFIFIRHSFYHEV